MGLTREALLKPLPVDIEEVPIPEMGGSVWVKGMTVRKRNIFERQFHRYLRSHYDLPARVKPFSQPGPLPIRPGQVHTRLLDWS